MRQINMDFGEQLNHHNKPQKASNQLWLKSLKCWESLQSIQSLCNQIPRWDMTEHLGVLLKDLWLCMSRIGVTNAMGDVDIILQTLNTHLEAHHQHSIDKHLEYFGSLMNFLNKNSSNNPGDLFVGFELNTMNQIESDMKKISDFVSHLRIIKNPLTPKNVESSMPMEDMNQIYDDYDFFQSIAGDLIAKSNNKKPTEESSLMGLDLRSHKDRLIDYRVHPKIRNFATPTTTSNVLLDEIRDETLSNLFQSTNK